MKTKLKLLKIGLAVMLAFLPGLGDAQTIISGPNITTSTWGPSGNPYIITADCTVVGGNTLTIQPGTVVWIGSGVSLTGNGMILAVGTTAQHITFQAPVSSQFWNTIIVNNTTGTNQFKYCDFQNANVALSFGANTVNEVIGCNFQNVTNGVKMYAYCSTISATILNCTFSNCFAQAIYGEAQGSSGFASWGVTAKIVPAIKNCYFNAVGDGCRFYIHGYTYYNGAGYGWATPTLLNNSFYNVSNSAIALDVGSAAGSSPVIMMNNTIVNAAKGISTSNPWDAKVQSSLFVGCTNAVTRSGSLSATVSYNGFYGNATNFTGYPSTYGMVLLANRNGTPSDVLYNIFSNPLFTSSSDFHLQAGSPAIDAGTPDWAYSDMCFSNGVSQGNSYPDLGAYGGPDAVNWLSVVPILPVQATMTYSNKITQVSWGAIPRSEYVVQYLTNFATVGTNKWFNFTNGDILAIDKPTSLIVATNQSRPQMFFRIQSLGRPAGN